MSLDTRTSATRISMLQRAYEVVADAVQPTASSALVGTLKYATNPYIICLLRLDYSDGNPRGRKNVQDVLRKHPLITVGAGLAKTISLRGPLTGNLGTPEAIDAERLTDVDRIALQNCGELLIRAVELSYGNGLAEEGKRLGKTLSDAGESVQGMLRVDPILTETMRSLALDLPEFGRGIESKFPDFTTEIDRAYDDFVKPALDDRSFQTSVSHDVSRTNDFGLEPPVLGGR